MKAECAPRVVLNHGWGHQIDEKDCLSIFADIVEYAERWANEGKIVIIAALDGTFQRQPFNSILELIPLAEEVLHPLSPGPTFQRSIILAITSWHHPIESRVNYTRCSESSHGLDNFSTGG